MKINYYFQFGNYGECYDKFWDFVVAFFMSIRRELKKVRIKIYASR